MPRRCSAAGPFQTHAAHLHARTVARACGRCLSAAQMRESATLYQVVSPCLLLLGTAASPCDQPASVMLAIQEQAASYVTTRSASIAARAAVSVLAAFAFAAAAGRASTVRYGHREKER